MHVLLVILLIAFVVAVSYAFWRWISGVDASVEDSFEDEFISVVTGVSAMGDFVATESVVLVASAVDEVEELAEELVDFFEPPVVLEQEPTVVEVDPVPTVSDTIDTSSDDTSSTDSVSSDD